MAASFDGAGDERLKTVMQALTRHLHAFLREVRLTEDEWNKGIEFLTAAGHITDDKRQEFILLSDVLGASMQTIAINNEAYANATEATVFGPFFVDDAPRINNGGDIAGGATGQPCWVEGTVTDTSGRPVPGARIEVWEADEDGFYDVQYGDDRTAGRAHLYSDDDGGYRFWGITPTPYPIPHDGPVGALLAASGRVAPARGAPALHGDRAGAAHAGDPHLRARRRAARLGLRVRGQGLVGHGLRGAAGRHADAGRPRRRGHVVAHRFDMVLAPAPSRHRDQPAPPESHSTTCHVVSYAQATESPRLNRLDYRHGVTTMVRNGRVRTVRAAAGLGVDGGAGRSARGLRRRRRRHDSVATAGTTTC